VTISRAILWIQRAQSDARTAEAILTRRVKLDDRNVGCHVALLCAQSIEKCIKGCLLLVGGEAKLTHDIANIIDDILSRVAAKRKSTGSEQNLNGLFRSPGVRKRVTQLLAWTPGNATPEQPNYEYPWPARVESEVPTGHELFKDADEQSDWVTHAKTLSDGAAKVAEALRRFQL
jgi:HEPN domain-containing protein